MGRAGRAAIRITRNQWQYAVVATRNASEKQTHTLDSPNLRTTFHNCRTPAAKAPQALTTAYVRTTPRGYAAALRSSAAVSR